VINSSVPGRTLIMGIINVTPDSFSGDGIRGMAGDVAERGHQLVEEGADLLDVGGESTRPGAVSVSCAREIARVVPAVIALARTVIVPISIDTSKAEVADRALLAGASIVNDVSGLVDSNMPQVVAAHGAVVIVGHHGGRGAGHQLLGAIRTHWRSQAVLLRQAGVSEQDIWVDPGLGMGKAWTENFLILRELASLREEGWPLVVGPSRKAMIGQVLGGDVSDRLEGSVALASLSASADARAVRVHDVASTCHALRTLERIQQAGRL